MNLCRYSKDTRRSCVVLAMPFVRILNLRGSIDRPSDRVPIALGQVCLTMAQVMNQIRKRVEKLDQLALNVQAHLSPRTAEWKTICQSGEHRAQRVRLVHQSTYNVQDKTLCINPVQYREIRSGTCACTAVCVAIFQVHRTWRTEKGKPVRVTVDVVGLRNHGVSRSGAVKRKIRSFLKPVALRIANPHSGDLSQINVRFTTFLSKGERTKYYAPIVSLLLDLECSARYRGTFVTNRSAGPRSDIDHLAVREEVCSEVLRKCASDVGFSVVGATRGPRGRTPCSFL